MKKFFVVALMLFYGVHLNAQKPDSLKTLKYIRVEYLHGPFYDHRKYSVAVDMHTADAVSVSYMFQTRGDKLWHKLYGFPKTGFSLTAANFNNNEVLGKTITMAAFSEFYFLNVKDCSAYFNSSAGCAYVTKSFDAQTNNMNMFVGSKFCAYFRFGIGFDLLKSKKVSYNLGLNFVHWSDGCTKLPNLGLNVLMLNVGAAYRINQSFKKPTVNDIPAFEKKFKFETSAAASLRESGYPDGPNYCVINLNTGVYRLRSHKFRYGAGFDYFRDPSVKFYYLRNNESFSKSDYNSLGVFASAGMAFGKLTTDFNFGYYLITSEQTDGNLYHRLSFNYHITDRIFAKIGLRTYFMKAQCIEFGTGISF